MSFITHAINKDAQAFKSLVEESLAEKVVMVLEALKIEVASQFFNEEIVDEAKEKMWKEPGKKDRTGGFGNKKRYDAFRKSWDKSEDPDKKSKKSIKEEGGVSGGVGSVRKKPTPPAAGSVKLPGEGGKEGGLEHAGRSTSSGGEKTGDAELPGQKGVSEATDRGDRGVKKIMPQKKFNKIAAGWSKKDKAPKLPQKKGSGSAEDRKSMD